MVKKTRALRPRKKATLPRGYRTVLADLKHLIAESRRRAISTVNRELVLLYWQIGSVIVQQQEKAKWGDAVVEQLAADLRAAFPDMKGLSTPNIWRTRQFFRACRDIDRWLTEEDRQPVRQSDEKTINLAPALRETRDEKLASALRESDPEIVSTVSGQLSSPELAGLIVSISWIHHTVIFGAVDTPAERYFYLKMAVRERWSVRELRREIDSDLFTRYVSVREHPEKCLPEEAEAGDLLPFKDHYVGKMQFYCAALDAHIKLTHEKPSIGLILCKSADRIQVRLALTAAAKKIGVATCQTALPDERLMKKFEADCRKTGG